MSDVVLVAVIMSSSTVLASIPTLIVSLRTRKQGQDNAKSIAEVHKAVNSGLTQQLANAKDSGKLEGRVELRQEQKDDKSNDRKD